jgi:serine/threonine protein kinase
MGRVLKAYDTMLDRTVALKLLAPELMAEEDPRKRFLREARLASALDHPNICMVYEIAEVDQQFFIAMQYVPGKTLKRVIGGKPLSLDGLLSIALQVADALEVAHSSGIIHRDIKSSNIIITPRGQAKVLDFGLAKLLTDKERATEDLTRVGSPMGTPSYMSPEQARCERVDHRSDIYSFGVVLYEMATGRMPFKANSSVDMMHAVIHDTYKPISEINEQLPQELIALIDKAMAKRASDRYQSMKPLLEELRRLNTAVRIGGQGVPDGVSVPFVVPKRQIPQGVFSKFFGSLFGRETQAEAQAGQAQVARSDSAVGGEFSLTNTTQKTIAVLPLRNLSGDPQSDFYGVSIAESLITELMRINSIAVIPSSLVAKYRDQSVDPARVRADLNVDMVLVGNFLKAGERLRVTAQLIDAERGGLLWSEKIDADARDVLAIQDRMAQRIIAGLSGGQVAVDPMLLLKDENEEVRMDAVRTLKFSHDPRALPALVEALRDASLKVKAEAVAAIVKMGEQATGPVITQLKDAMDEGDHLTARFAAKALGEIGDRSISSVLVELLSSDDRFVACEAVLAIGRLSETKAVPALIDLLTDPNGNIRFCAAEALGEMCDPRARDSLQAALSDEDEGVRAKVRWALTRLRNAGRAFGLERRAHSS